MASVLFEEQLHEREIQRNKKYKLMNTKHWDFSYWEKQSYLQVMYNQQKMH